MKDNEVKVILAVMLALTVVFLLAILIGGAIDAWTKISLEKAKNANCIGIVEKAE